MKALSSNLLHWKHRWLSLCTAHHQCLNNTIATLTRQWFKCKMHGRDMHHDRLLHAESSLWKPTWCFVVPRWTASCPHSLPNQCYLSGPATKSENGWEAGVREQERQGSIQCWSWVTMGSHWANGTRPHCAAYVWCPSDLLPFIDCRALWLW